MNLHTILALLEAVPVPEAITLALVPLVAVTFIVIEMLTDDEDEP